MPHDDEIDISELVDEGTTQTEQLQRFAPQHSVKGFSLALSSGPNAGQTWKSRGERFSIGSHPSNQLVLDDPSVSRFHCEIRADRRGIWCSDLDSSNGTRLDGVAVGMGGLREGSQISCGRSVLTFHLASEATSLPLSEHSEFGSLVGASVAMRAMFAVLERCAQSDATLLVEGETGTGKEGTAEAIHLHSARSHGPFIVVDCGAMPAQLLESELFGHERGAFTGANNKRIGAFEEANNGTIFLDEIGELPLELQPKLLRVLEQKQIRRVGSNRHESVNVRVIAATNRDLRSQVNEGIFRSDLYYRLAVLTVQLPPLRERPDDIPLLVEHFKQRLGVTPEAAAEIFSPDFLNRLQRATWPGNVRELRNFLERCVVMRQKLPLHVHQADGEGAHEGLSIDARVSYTEARRAVLERFEQGYLAALLDLHDGNVSAAARGAGMDRPYLHKLLQRHALRPRKD
ncbi:MAG: hypothetical protein RJA70_4337 [Pseudomonadota bacterium]|jgi:DNA-binding NtrC family response regulator